MIELIIDLIKYVVIGLVLWFVIFQIPGAFNFIWSLIL